MSRTDKEGSGENPFADNNQSFESQPSIPLYDRDTEKADLAFNKGPQQVAAPNFPALDSSVFLLSILISDRGR